MMALSKGRWKLSEEEGLAQGRHGHPLSGGRVRKVGAVGRLCGCEKEGEGEGEGAARRVRDGRSTEG